MKTTTTTKQSNKPAATTPAAEYITDAEAGAIVGEIIPYVAGDPTNDPVARSLIAIINWLVDCPEDNREINGCVLRQAIFPHTDAFCRAMESFADASGGKPVAA